MLKTIIPSSAESAINNQQLSQINQNIAKLAEYLSDPKNRQATINRQLLTDFDNEEKILRNLANL